MFHPKHQWRYTENHHIFIYKFRLSVCLFVSNKRQNGWTDRAQILCETSRDPREGLCMIKIFKKCVLKVFIFVKCRKCAKKYYEIRKLFCFCFMLYKEKMFTEYKHKSASVRNFKHFSFWDRFILVNSLYIELKIQK